LTAILFNINAAALAATSEAFRSLDLHDGGAGNSADTQATRQTQTVAQRSAGSDNMILAQSVGSESEDRQPDSIELKPITVEGQVETATSPVEGYVAGRSASATKTDTPLIETPQSISVITRERIEAQNVEDLGQALRYTPGIQGEPFGFEPRLTFLRIRGFDATTTSLFRDGLRLSNPRFAVSYGLEPYGAERIEVPRGPASVLYGQASPGGLVNYVSKRPTLVPFHEVELEVGNYDRHEGKFDLSGPIDADGTFSYRLTGLARESDTQVDFIADDRVFIAPAFTWRPSEDTALTLLARYQEDETRSSQALPAAGTLFPNPNGEIPLDRFTGEPAIDRYDRTEYSVSSLFEHRFNETWTFRQHARYQASDLDDVSVFSNAVRADLRTVERARFDNFGELDEVALDNQAQLEFTTGPLAHSGLFGLDYRRADIRSLQAFGDAPPIDIFNPVYGAGVPTPPVFKDDEIDLEQLGLYLQDQIKLYDRWVFQLGGRYDWADTEIENNLAPEAPVGRDDGEFTGRAGVVYLSDIGLAPYFSYAESFLPPIESTASGELFEPETGRQYEVGVKYQPPGVNSFVTVALFDLTRENFIQFNPTSFAPEQTGEARSRGIELEGVASFDFGLDLIATYTYQDVEITETNNPVELGQRPTQVPEQTASLWADYTIQGGALNGLGFGGGVRYLGSTFGDEANTLKVPDVTLFDAVIHYDWNRFQFAVNAQNVFDNEYIASAFVRTGSPFAVAGQERTIIGSLRYRW
jgi:iron complex outermembrane recepter protein